MAIVRRRCPKSIEWHEAARGGNVLRCARTLVPSHLQLRDADEGTRSCRCPRPGRAGAQTAAPSDRFVTEWAIPIFTAVPADRSGGVLVGSPRRHEIGRGRNAGSARSRCGRRDAGTPPRSRLAPAAVTVPPRAGRAAAQINRVCAGSVPGLSLFYANANSGVSTLSMAGSHSNIPT